MLLDEPSEVDAGAMLDLERRCGPFLLWRIGDLSFGLHALLVGDSQIGDSLWLHRVEGMVEVERHASPRTLPVQ